MSNKLFRSLRYVKNKPVEISVGISPEEAAQDNVGDDKAKLVFTTDRRIFLNGEEIARTKGDERPKPIVKKAIPRFPMKGSRYVVRRCKFDGAYMLNFIVSKKMNEGSTGEINLSELDAEVVRIFGEENIQKRNLTAIATTDGYTVLTWEPIFRVSDYTKLNGNSRYAFKVLVQYRLSIPRFLKNNFVLRINTGDILSEPNFELELYNGTEYGTRFVSDEPCASPDYAIMNGNLFCVKMPNVENSYDTTDGKHISPEMESAIITHNVYRKMMAYYKCREYENFSIRASIRRGMWIRNTRFGLVMKKKLHRFYAIKKHGRSREQSIHYVDFKFAPVLYKDVPQWRVIKNDVP